jgi:hypothetical protein
MALGADSVGEPSEKMFRQQENIPTAAARRAIVMVKNTILQVPAVTACRVIIRGRQIPRQRPLLGAAQAHALLLNNFQELDLVSGLVPSRRGKTARRPRKSLTGSLASVCRY